MSIYDRLNEQQKEAVFCTEGPLLILAGAGSGKTSVLTHRVAYLIDEVGVNPYNILAITFTNKAAEEMRNRVDSMVGNEAGAVFVSTFHSMCVRILRRFANNIGYDSNFTIYDSDDQKQVIKEVCKKLNIDTKQIKERTILNAISSCKDEMITPDEYAMSTMGDLVKQKYAKCYREYQDTLKKNNAFDFDDLLMKTVELFKSCPDVLLNYQNRWTYIMVDEYQDTNTVQFELIRLLAGTNKNLCVVGDDDQSIYKFRGANIRNILDFEKYYPEAKVVKLEQNYRSVQNILDAANSVIRNNSARKEKALWSSKEKGELIHFRQFDTSFEEAEYVADTIRKSVRDGKSGYQENAVLYRTNAQSRGFEEMMVKSNLPYRIVGGVNFYSRREIKDLLAYLKTIDNGMDDLAVKRIINVPKRGIGATTIGKIQDAADRLGLSFFETLCMPETADIKGPTAEKLHNFTNMILMFRAKNEAFGPAKLLQEILDTTDYITQMEVDSEEEANERLENIEEFMNKVVSYEQEAEEPTLSELLSEIALVADVDSMSSEEERILLMTIHSAKGLEFKNVYLVGMEDGLFPSYMSVSAGDVEVEEERRLAYVAITRAKETLTITSAKARMVHGETQYNPISRFVREIPKNLFDIAPMAQRKYSDYNDYDEDGYHRPSSYHDDEYSGFSRSQNTSYNGFRRESDRESTYAGFRREPSSIQTATSYRRSINVSIPKKTPEEVKPYAIRQPISMAGIQKGSELTASSDYEVGDRVKHIKFGEGTVLSIVQEPRDKKVSVQFDQYGIKVMYASFAKLKKV